MHFVIKPWWQVWKGFCVKEAVYIIAETKPTLRVSDFCKFLDVFLDIFSESVYASHWHQPDCLECRAVVLTENSRVEQ